MKMKMFLELLFKRVMESTRRLTTVWETTLNLCFCLFSDLFLDTSDVIPIPDHRSNSFFNVEVYTLRTHHKSLFSSFLESELI